MSLRPNSKADARKQRYKVAVDTVEARRKREENLVEIRKSKREESLLKKRREGVSSVPNSQLSTGYDQAISLNEKLQNLPATVYALASDDIQTKEVALVYLRKMLSVESNPPINAVIQSGAVPVLISILKMSDFPQLQFEAAWALTNIVSGTSENTKVVIDYGALPIFVDLLTSANDNLREQAVWALGNIAGDSAPFRDLALSHGALGQVLAQVKESARISMIRNATWAVSNFCRGKPQPVFDEVRYALPALQWLINLQDDDVLADACWALSYLSDGPNLKIQAVIEAGICPKLVELLSHPSPFVIVPALRTVGNIVTGDDVQTQAAIDNGALPRILHLLTIQPTKKTITKEACWTISNITAGTRSQVQAVINAKIFPPLIFLLANAEFDIKKEAAWAVSNATAGGDDEQINYLASQGCIQPLCDLLTCPDARIITVCLEGLENILRVGEADKNLGVTEVNAYATLIEEAGGLDKIEDLQSHENGEVYEKAVRILENYLAEDDLEEMLATSDTPQVGFGFSTDKELEVPPGGFNFM
eukprot:PITA_23799